MPSVAVCYKMRDRAPPWWVSFIVLVLVTAAMFRLTVLLLPQGLYDTLTTVAFSFNEKTSGPGTQTCSPPTERLLSDSVEFTDDILPLPADVQIDVEVPENRTFNIGQDYNITVNLKISNSAESFRRKLRDGILELHVRTLGAHVAYHPSAWTGEGDVVLISFAPKETGPCILDMTLRDFDELWNMKVYRVAHLPIVVLPPQSSTDKAPDATSSATEQLEALTALNNESSRTNFREQPISQLLQYHTPQLSLPLRTICNEFRDQPGRWLRCDQVCKMPNLMLTNESRPAPCAVIIGDLNSCLTYNGT